LFLSCAIACISLKQHLAPPGMRMYVHRMTCFLPCGNAGGWQLAGRSTRAAPTAASPTIFRRGIAGGGLLPRVTCAKLRLQTLAAACPSRQHHLLTGRDEQLFARWRLPETRTTAREEERALLARPDCRRAAAPLRSAPAFFLYPRVTCGMATRGGASTVKRLGRSNHQARWRRLRFSAPRAGLLPRDVAACSRISTILEGEVAVACNAFFAGTVGAIPCSVGRAFLLSPLTRCSRMYVLVWAGRGRRRGDLISATLWRIGGTFCYTVKSVVGHTGFCWRILFTVYLTCRTFSANAAVARLWYRHAVGRTVCTDALAKNEIPDERAALALAPRPVFRPSSSGGWRMFWRTTLLLPMAISICDVTAR